MKDSVLLLITGLVCAGFSWLFFAYFQDKAFTILLFIALISILTKPVKSKFGNKRSSKE